MEKNSVRQSNLLSQDLNETKLREDLLKEENQKLIQQLEETQAQLEKFEAEHE